MLTFNRFLSLVSADENSSDWQLPVVVALIVILVLASAVFGYYLCNRLKKGRVYLECNLDVARVKFTLRNHEEA